MTGAPYLKYEAIGKRADEFLKKYHPGLELPVPIEKIIEFALKLDIIPHQDAPEREPARYRLV